MLIAPGQKAVSLMTAQLGKIPLHAEIIEFQPPKIKRTTVDTTGGRYVKTTMAVGLEELKFTLKLSGAISLAALGFEAGDAIQVNLGTKLENNLPTAESHYMRVKYFDVDSGSLKSGALAETTIEASLVEYRLTEFGKEIHNINLNTMKTIIFGQDETLAIKGGMVLGAINV